MPTTFTTTTESLITYTGIELVSSKKFYRLNDTYDTISVEIVAHKSDGTVENLAFEDLSIRGFRTSVAGDQNFLVIFDKFFLEVDYIVLEDFAFEIYMDYYEDAINLNGNALKLALNNIINEGFNNLLYGDARYILDEADADPNNPGNIILVYTGMSVSGAWDGGATWNREHVWPQSRLGVYVGYDEDDFPSKATDLHNLKPADPDENAVRSNDYFDWFKTDKTYEPRDEVKGDIARILFYMATMYFELTLNDDELSLSLNRTMGILSVLLEWNEVDPVDDFERNRNEVIYSYQNNRNPFIDYPEFANLIWGDLAD
jgi:endonuclease I